MTDNSLSDYFAALERIIAGIPLHVPKGAKITNDSVAVEAGRKKGSIKKSRDNFSNLIAAIKLAAEEQNKKSSNVQDKLNNTKIKAAQYRTDLEAALARELSLLYEVYELKKQLAKITGSNIIPIRKE